MYEHHAIVSDGLSLAALREQAHINAAAKAAGNNPDFSQLIREGRVGIEASPRLLPVRGGKRRRPRALKNALSTFANRTLFARADVLIYPEKLFGSYFCLILSSRS